VIRLSDADAVAASSGRCVMQSGANDQAGFARFCGVISELRGIAEDAVAVLSGLSRNIRVEKAHAMFVRFR